MKVYENVTPSTNLFTKSYQSLLTLIIINKNNLIRIKLFVMHTFVPILLVLTIIIDNNE